MYLQIHTKQNRKYEIPHGLSEKFLIVIRATSLVFQSHEASGIRVAKWRSFWHVLEAIVKFIEENKNRECKKHIKFILFYLKLVFICEENK